MQTMEEPIGLIEVQADWDPEAKVWIATSKAVPGLITEAGRREDLMARVEVMIPELLSTDDGADKGTMAVEVVLHSNGDEEWSTVHVSAA